jgi:pSer/pThr/pTyr-binding forkhead associated (FHA) protein
MSAEVQQPSGQAPDKSSGELEQVGTLTRLADNRQYSLGFGSLRVGRQRRADLVITDKTVSRHHADLCYESGRYVLYDHSTNGTWINGTLVAVAQPLRNGDRVKFGKVEFSFTLKSVPKEVALREAEATAPKKIPRTSTVIMKGGKGKRRIGRLALKVLLAVLAAVIVAAVLINFLLPDLAARIIEQLPPGLQGALGGGG